MAVPGTDAGARRGAPVQAWARCEDRSGHSVLRQYFPRKRERGRALPHRVSTYFYMAWDGRVSRKEIFLGESSLAEYGRERKTKTKSYGSPEAPRVLTVGFRTAAAANPISRSAPHPDNIL